MGKLYPVGIQNFEKLRGDGYWYVDKTEQMYRLVTTGSYYFLSRPRRFGKSLLISTLEAYFQGKKELFEGLAVHGLEKEWLEYPILHLDLNTRKYDTPEALEQELSKHLEQWEKEYGDEYSGRAVEERFYHIIRMAYEKTGRRVVILVDEYDKPMLQAIGDDVLQDRYRSTLKAFYGALKSQDGYIKFAFLTGVTKFGKVSVFSDLNNLMDISRDERYTDICGISEKELLDNFSEDIQELAGANGQTYEQACAQLKEDYDGYHFCPDSIGIYNPFSLLNTFKSRRYGSYRFETGTPTYLVELLKKNRCDLKETFGIEADDGMLDNIFIDDNPVPVLYQSGYLTIVGHGSLPGTYRLGFPDLEVERNFVRYIFPFYANVDRVRSASEIKQFVRDVRSGDIDGFMERLRSFLAGCPYELARDIELHYQNVLFIVFRLAGLYTEVEYRTSRGRIDLVLQTADYIYVMEFKLDGSAEDAIKQIEDRQYALPFASDPRKLFKIGVNFSSTTRNIEKWVVRLEAV